MKIPTSFLITLFIAVNTVIAGPITTDNSTSKNDDALKDQKIKVFYFHNTRRCETCNAVEDVTTALIV